MLYVRQADATPPPSIFSSLSIAGAKFTWGRGGFAFTPTQSTVTLNYSTHSCAAFYSTRGSTYPQSCASRHQVLTLLEPNIPTSLCP